MPELVQGRSEMEASTRGADSPIQEFPKISASIQTPNSRALIARTPIQKDPHSMGNTCASCVYGVCMGKCMCWGLRQAFLAFSIRV